MLVVLSTSGFISAQEARQVTDNFQTADGRQVSSNFAVRSSPVQQMQMNEKQEGVDSLQTQKDPILFYTLERDKEFAHWSISGGIGASIFDGDITEPAKRIVPSSSLDWGFAGVIERSFNPIWGLGFEYGAMPYGAETKTQELKGFVNEWDVFLSVNILNLFYHSRPQKWGIFVNVGMGMSYYNAKMTDKKTGEAVIGPGNKPMDLEGGISWAWPLAGLVEYNINKDFAVGFKAEYRLHDKDNFEGQVINVREGNWNDAFELFTLTFRYKPHFGKNYHVRNYGYGDPDISGLEERLADLEEQLKNMSKVDSCCILNTERIKQLEEELAKKPDTVIMETPAPPVKTIDEEGVKRVFREALRGIQFETNKADIKPISFSILDNVVTIMKENPDYTLQIIGHTDNVGAASYNLNLSDKRAASVRTYLMDRGINGNRLSSEGKGLTMPVASNNTEDGRALNRRVEFIVSQNGVVVLKSE